MRERAALREFQLLETLQHPGILRAYNFTEHELGPALILEHDPLAIRLDHFLAQQQDKLSIDTRLDLVRQIAEVVRYAHDKKVVHRALSPAEHPRHPGRQRPAADQGLQLAGRLPRAVKLHGRVPHRVGHVARGPLVEDASTAYMAPEALTDDNLGEHLDVFSLGAIAYHIFSGVAPAANGLELSNKLRETKRPPDQLRPQRGRRGPAVPDPVQHPSRGAGPHRHGRRFPGRAGRRGERADHPRPGLRRGPGPGQGRRADPRRLQGRSAYRPGGLLDRPARRAGRQGIRAQGGQRPAAQQPAQGRGRRAPEAPPPAYHRVRR